MFPLLLKEVIFIFLFREFKYVKIEILPIYQEYHFFLLSTLPDDMPFELFHYSLTRKLYLERAFNAVFIQNLDNIMLMRDKL